MNMRIKNFVFGVFVGFATLYIAYLATGYEQLEPYVSLATLGCLVILAGLGFLEFFGSLACMVQEVEAEEVEEDDN